MKLAAIVTAIIAVFLGGAFTYAQLTKPDPQSQAAHDSALARVRGLQPRRDTLIQRDTLIRNVVRIERAKAETLTVVIREALPDTVRPLLDSLTASHGRAIDSVASLASSWRQLYDTTQVELDSALSREASLLRQRKASPLAVVIGIAATPRGIQPAITVGFRIGLPKIF